MAEGQLIAKYKNGVKRIINLSPMFFLTTNDGVNFESKKLVTKSPVIKAIELCQYLDKDCYSIELFRGDRVLIKEFYPKNKPEELLTS